MKKFVAGNAEYIVEYASESALYKELTDIIVEELKNAENEESVSELLAKNKDVTQTTLHMLHAGLLENQPNWDISKTKSVLKQYLEDNKGTDKGSCKALRSELLEVMEEDGFFDLIG